MTIQLFLRKGYHRLPERIKSCFSPVVTGYRRFQEAYRPLFLYRGTTGANHIPFTFAYIGADLNHQNFWSHHILDTDIEKTFLCNHFISKTTAYLSKTLPRCSMILCEENSFAADYFEDKFVLRIPRWIRLEIDISQPMEAMCRSRHNNYKRIREKISQHSFNYLITKSPSVFRDFYANMYVPYIKSRFPGTSIIMTYPEMFDDQIPRELFLIRKGEKVVAGVVVNYWPEKPAMGWFGVLQSNFDYVQQGALQAAYYFSIVEMQKRGFTRLNIGGSRPIINDRVTRHKIRMLARIDYTSRYESKENLLFILLQDSRGLRDFLVNNQIIALAKDGKPICTSWLQPQPFISQTEFVDAAMLSERAGFHDHDVFLFDCAKIPRGWLEMDCCHHVTVKTADNYFLQHNDNNG